MNEYLSEAVVLDKEGIGDLDARVSLFTKKFGKLTAKAKSARRIVSKLSPHLEPGNVIQARLIEKGALHIVDALKQSRLSTNPNSLYFLNRILPDGEQDLRLWQMLLSGAFDWTRALGILGWDPSEAMCGLCATDKPHAFSVFRQEFFCSGCASKFSGSALLYI